MIDTNKQYYAKTLLFGEHIVIKGAEALAMPLSLFSGQWAYCPPAERTDYQHQLQDFAEYLVDVDAYINVDLMEYELGRGLYFQSDIPTGFGAGSSGALVAAVYDAFCERKTENLAKLRTTLGRMESFFHGASSGTDPLVSYTNKVIHIQGNKIEAMELPDYERKTNAAIFLLDTQKERKTGPLVELFLKKYETTNLSDICDETLIPVNNMAIQAFLFKEKDILLQTFSLISKIQIEYFNDLIPSDFYRLWDYGNMEDDFYLKLCGAGGGGFILGITPDLKKTKTLLANQELLPILYL